jgi:hypothetical protein
MVVWVRVLLVILAPMLAFAAAVFLNRYALPHDVHMRLRLAKLNGAPAARLLIFQDLPALAVLLLAFKFHYWVIIFILTLPLRWCAERRGTKGMLGSLLAVMPTLLMASSVFVGIALQAMGFDTLRFGPGPSK